VTISAQFFSLIISSTILHTPAFSEYFYFSLFSLILIFFTIFAVRNNQNSKLPFLFSIFPMLSIIEPSVLFDFTSKFLGLSSETFMSVDLDVFVYPIAVMTLIILLMFAFNKSTKSILVVFVFVCWIPAATGSENAYLFNSYKQDIGAQRDYLADVADLTDLWARLNRLDLTAIWHEGDMYLNPLQSALVFGPTRLNGLGGDTNVPNLDNWNCGRFWGSRWVDDECFSDGRDLSASPKMIITLHNFRGMNPDAINFIISQEFRSHMKRIGYTSYEMNLFRSQNVVYVVWSRIIN
jgi:hypothetical protein